MDMHKPELKPANPRFSSGPCSKRPGWSFDNLHGALLGRSHRSAQGKEKLKNVIDLHRALLGIPDDYKIGIIPASDTGAIETAFWSMLGDRPIDIMVWENFSKEWQTDIETHLELTPNVYPAPYGELPDLSRINKDHDVVFVWNGTTSGICIPDGDWISDERKGLTFCDATSAVFSYDLPWDKLDVTTWSWQKTLGGEAAHGMLVLSPNAVKRLETFKPKRALPKIFRLTQDGQLNEGIFEGLTINTPSMMAVEDCLDALNWVKDIGGVTATIERSINNSNIIRDWLTQQNWIDYLTKDPRTQSQTSICLKITDPWFIAQSPEEQPVLIQKMCTLLEDEHAGYDIKNYLTAPAGFRIWCGATIEASDIKLLLPWLKWAYETVKTKHS